MRAENPAGETYVAITINVRKGYCMPEGVFERTLVGEVAVYQCALQGSYVGTQKRACVLGEKDGEWQTNKQTNKMLTENLQACFSLKGPHPSPIRLS